MFKKIKPTAEPAAAAPKAPKYDRPKILLIDVGPESKKALDEEGYNVSSGTFGTPYKVAKGANYEPVVFRAVLPNYTEQEIIVVDVQADEAVAGPPGEKITPMEELDWWAKCNRGIIDPRPRSMVMVQEEFARILHNGGAFVIFADERYSQTLAWAQHFGRYDGLSIQQELPFDNWSFLSLLSSLGIKSDHGKEMNPIEDDHPLAKLLAAHLKGGAFSCTFEPNWQIKDEWLTLAYNKFGAAVAGLIAPKKKTEGGWIFIFPRISRRAEFLATFFKNVLPDLCPHLFPYAEGQNWIHRKEYELPSVLERVVQISKIQDEAAHKVEVLENEIRAERAANQFLYDLIRETGDNLVQAVKRTLRLIGFLTVVDVDEEMKKHGKSNSLREDLRIHDISPVLVVDVKGITGKPADAEALQAQKHAFIFIQEQKRADVRGLTIINHQRHLPPLDRDNEMPYRKEILDNAVQLSLGLITAWDLFRLTRGFLRNGWKPEHVKPVFYTTGRIQPIPTHYEYVGKVKQVWKAAFSVLIEAGEVKVGDRVAIEFPVDFEEQTMLSLRLNNADVTAAGPGDEVGIARAEHFSKVKCGFPVYRLKNV